MWIDTSTEKILIMIRTSIIYTPPSGDLFPVTHSFRYVPGRENSIPSIAVRIGASQARRTGWERNTGTDNDEQTEIEVQKQREMWKGKCVCVGRGRGRKEKN